MAVETEDSTQVPGDRAARQIERLRITHMKMPRKHEIHSGLLDCIREFPEPPDQMPRGAVRRRGGRMMHHKHPQRLRIRLAIQRIQPRHLIRERRPRDQSRCQPAGRAEFNPTTMTPGARHTGSRSRPMVLR